MAVDSGMQSLSNTLSGLSASDAGALISWSSTINKNGYTPVSGVIINDSFLETTKQDVVSAITPLIKENFEKNSSQVLSALDAVIRTSDQLQKYYHMAIAQSKTDNIMQSIPQLRTLVSNNVALSKANLLTQWNLVNQLIMGNTLHTSLTTGYFSEKEYMQLGYAEDESQFVESASIVTSRMYQLVAGLTDISGNNSSDKMKKIFQQHYSGLRNSISKGRSDNELKTAYIWLWYAHRDWYEEAQNHAPNQTYQDLFFGDRGSSGAGFEAFCQHMTLYHNMTGEGDQLISASSNIHGSVEQEEGVPNFFDTLATSGQASTAFYASGDILTLDANGNIAINTQVKSSKDALQQSVLRCKEISALCKQFSAMYKGKFATLSQQVAEKLVTTAMQQSSSNLNKAINDTVQDIIDQIHI